MPRKIRELEEDLQRAGFIWMKGKGSHRHWTHPRYPGKVTMSGKPGDDAHHYQEEKVQAALKRVGGKQ